MRETIRYEIVSTSLGRMLIAASERGVCEASFGESEAVLVTECSRRFAGADVVAADKRMRELARTVAAVVEDPLVTAEIPLDMRGTRFQLAVWEALRDIPPGATMSYSGLAHAIGRPTAVRAVAGACSANPVAVVVPCHRVIGADGSLTGYASGLERKRTLLEREGVL